MKINVLEFLEDSLRQFPARIAVSDRLTEYTYQQLHSRAGGLATELLNRTAAQSRPVAIYLPKGADNIIAFMAVLYSANIYAPLDYKAPPERLRAILASLEPVLVISCEQGVPALLQAGVAQENIVLISAAACAASPAQWQALRVRWQGLVDTDPAYILHTSGSTGLPKGVVISHRGIIDYICWAQSVFKVGCENVIGNQAPFYFDNSTLDIYIALSAGAHLHIIPEEAFIFPQQLVSHLQERGITFLFWVPSIMVNVANFGVLEHTALPALRYVLFAGEVMPTRHMNIWKQHVPHALFANLYGPTEITVDCTFYIVERDFADDEPLPIGIACRNSGLLILNEQNESCAQGQTGELCVKGSSLAMGYWRQPAKTAEVFVQNPLNPYFPEIIYRTGDLVYVNERGEIMYVGRKDSQIKHMGVRIELGEIEQAVASLPGVAEACVLYNEQEKQIVLFYVAAAGVTVAELRRGFAPVLPKVMWPTVFHGLGQLPKNTSGKIDRKSLSQMLAGG